MTERPPRLIDRVLAMVEEEPGVTRRDIAAAVYGDAPTDRQMRCISVTICRSREQLRAQGIRIAGGRGHGYRIRPAEGGR